MCFSRRENTHTIITHTHTHTLTRKHTASRFRINTENRFSIFVCLKRTHRTVLRLFSSSRQNLEHVIHTVEHQKSRNNTRTHVTRSVLFIQKQHTDAERVSQFSSGILPSAFAQSHSKSQSSPISSRATRSSGSDLLTCDLSSTNWNITDYCSRQRRQRSPSVVVVSTPLTVRENRRI